MEKVGSTKEFKKQQAHIHKFISIIISLCNTMWTAARLLLLCEGMHQQCTFPSK